MGVVTAVSFQGVDLNNDTYKALDLNPMGSPNKSTVLLPIARADGSLRVFQKYDAKTLTLIGNVKSDSKANLNLAVDYLKQLLSAASGVLQYEWAYGVRIHKCTVTDLKCDIGQENISFAPYVAVFECESPFATDGTSNALVTAQSITTAGKNFAFTIDGTYTASPIITLQISALNPVISPVQIVVANVAANQYLTIEETFKVGDVITIDCENYRVFVSGRLVRAKGQFPQFAVGGGSLQYNDNATTRTIVANVTAARKYL